MHVCFWGEERTSTAHDFLEVNVSWARESRIFSGGIVETITEHSTGKYYAISHAGLVATAIEITCTSLGAGKPMRRREFMALIAGAIFTLPFASMAQEAGRT